MVSKSIALSTPFFLGPSRLRVWMAEICGRDLLDRVKKRFPEVEFPADGSQKSAEVAATLEHVQKFLLEKVKMRIDDATHQVLGYSDWWDSDMAELPKFFSFQEEVEELWRCMVRMHQLGVPLTLGEKRSERFTLFQDIVIRGSLESSIDAEALIGPKSKFLEIIGGTMVELYPHPSDPSGPRVSRSLSWMDLGSTTIMAREKLPSD